MEKLTAQRVKALTEEFYSYFSGIKLSGLKDGIYFTSSEERNKTLDGYGCGYSVYILERNGLCAVSYSPGCKDYFDSLKGLGAEDIISEANRRFKLKKTKLMLFERETVNDYGGAKELVGADYPLYEDFFRKAHPNADYDGWLFIVCLKKAFALNTNATAITKHLSL